MEEEHKNITIKAAVKLYENTDPSMTPVRNLKSGRHSFVKDAQRFAEEHKLHLDPAGFPRACINQRRW